MDSLLISKPSRENTIFPNKEYIYRSILHSKGCNVDEQGRVCDFGLVSDPNFTFAVGSYLQDSNISETTTGNVEKAPYGFQGEVNIQPINYEKTSSSVITIVQTTDPVYTLTSDIAIVEGKNYYTRTGTEGSYTYTKVETPRLEDIASYYEITTEAIHKAYIAGSNTVESIFITSLF